MAMHVCIPLFKRLRQEDHKFQASLGYTARPCLKRLKKQKEKKED
jgi:hypothetical protein